MSRNGYQWSKASANPFFDGTNHFGGAAPDNPAVLRDPETGDAVTINGSYWMLYGPDDVAIAEGSSLTSWTDRGAIISDADSGAESWESSSVGPADFLYLPGESDPFWVFYFGVDGSGNRAIGIATSSTVDSGYARLSSENPIVPSNTFSSGDGAEDFRVQKGSDGTWRAASEADSVTTGVAVKALTTTSDPPKNGWTNEGDLLSTDSGYSFVANPTLIRREYGGTTYYDCYYEGIKTSGDNVGLYAWAAESDFLTPSNWTIEGSFLCPTDSWEGGDTIPNSVIRVDEEQHVYYTGNRSTDKKIGKTIGSWTEAGLKQAGGAATFADGGAQTNVRSICDSFEDESLSEYAATSDMTVVDQGKVPVGSQHGFKLLQSTRTDGKIGAATTTSGLPHYPSQGDTFKWRVKEVSESSIIIRHPFGLQSNVSPGVQNNPDEENGYHVRLRFDNDSLELAKQDGSFSVLASDSSMTYSLSTWYEPEVDWATDGTITVTLYDLSGTQLGQVSATDTTYTSGGIGFSSDDMGSGTETYWEFHRILP